jgi:hypothetical protein
MTRDEAFAQCPSDSYVEFYANQWLVIPLAPIDQTKFFTCQPTEEASPHTAVHRKGSNANDNQ